MPVLFLVIVEYESVWLRACVYVCVCVSVWASNIKIVCENMLVCVASLRMATIPNCYSYNKVKKKSSSPKISFSSYFIFESNKILRYWVIVIKWCFYLYLLSSSMASSHYCISWCYLQTFSKKNLSHYLWKDENNYDDWNNFYILNHMISKIVIW